MTMLSRFRELSRDDRRLIVLAPMVLGFIRVSLFVMPFGTVLSLVDRFSSRFPTLNRNAGAPSSRVAWAISAAARRIPCRTNCLSQALAGKLLLIMEGRPSSLRIGVASRESGRLVAHAWLESDGEIVLGGEYAEQYRQLPDFDGVRH